MNCAGASLSLLSVCLPCRLSPCLFVFVFLFLLPCPVVCFSLSSVSFEATLYIFRATTLLLLRGPMVAPTRPLDAHGRVATTLDCGILRVTKGNTTC